MVIYFKLVVVDDQDTTSFLACALDFLGVLEKSINKIKHEFTIILYKDGIRNRDCHFGLTFNCVYSIFGAFLFYLLDN